MVRSPHAAASREAGQALVLALVAVLVLGAALALVASSLVSRMQRIRVETRGTALLALSDAAVAETLAQLAARPSGGGVEARELGGGTIESSVSHGAAGAFTIVARATFQGYAMAVEVVGRTTDQGPRVSGWRRLPPSPEESGGGGFEVPGR